MSSPKGPVITGVHHVCLTVTDIDASMNWYQQLFQAGRWPGRLPLADRAALEAWSDRLDELNIGHTGIRRRPNGPYATVVFRDPDNNQLEFAAPMPTDQ